MRYSVIPGMHLSRLKSGMKVLLTLFLICVSLGLWVSALKYTNRAAFSADGATLYFQGDPATLEDDDPFGLGIPESALEAADGAPALRIHEPKSLGFLVDVTHPHAFTVPVLFFILFHFLSLTRLREWQKVVAHIYGFLSLLAAFGSPWLMSFGWEVGWLFVMSGVNLFACFAAVILVLLYETWCVAPPRGPGSGATPAEGAVPMGHPRPRAEPDE